MLCSRWEKSESSLEHSKEDPGLRGHDVIEINSREAAESS
jgi:hypothetical protein